MKGDFSRLATGRGYSRVLMQQGRLQTDADLNTQAALAAEAQAALVRDLVGPAGGPADAGFGLRGHGGFVFDGHPRGFRIERPHGVRLSGDSFTLEGWIKPAPGAVGGVIVARRGRADTPGGGFRLDLDDRGRVRFLLVERVRVTAVEAFDDDEVLIEEVDEELAEAELTAPRALAPGRFTHVAVVAHEGRLRLHLDGGLAAERSLGACAPFAAAPVRVGAGFRGVLDGLHLWRVAFGPELLHLRARGAPLADLVEFEPEWRLSHLLDPPHHEDGPPAEAPAAAQPELVVGRGRYYVEGMASEMEHDTFLQDQPQGPGVSLPHPALIARRRGPHLAWLESADVVVTAHEDEGLRDPAFGPADTSARLRTVSRVRLSLGAEGLDDVRAGRPPGAVAFERAPDTTLGDAALLRVEIHEAGFASLPHDASRPSRQGFALHHLGEDGRAVLEDAAFGEEALWRPGRPVEVVRPEDGLVHPAHVRRVHTGDDGRTRLELDWASASDDRVGGRAGWRLRPLATFKWSCDNTAFAAPVIGFDPGGRELRLPDGGGALDVLAAGDSVEVGDLELTLRRIPAPLHTVRHVDLDDAEDGVSVVLEASSADPLGATDAARLARRPVVRRWDAVEGAGRRPLAPVDAHRPVRLGHGVQARFGAGWYDAGEAWTCAVRDRLDWPRDASGAAVAMAAQHGRTRCAELATVRFDDGETVVRDLRRTFPAMAQPARWERLVRVDLGPAHAPEVEVEALATEPLVETQQLVEVVVEAPSAPREPAGACMLSRRPEPAEGWRVASGRVVARRPEPRWAARRSSGVRLSGPLAAAALGRRLAVLDREGAHWSFDPATSAWETRAPLAMSGFGPSSLAQLHGRLHVLGYDGAYGGTWHTSYDAQADAWREHAALADHRREACVCAAGDLLYAAGGREGPSKHASAAFHAYDPAEDRWRPRPSLPHAATKAALASWGGRIHLFGGMADRPFPGGGRPSASRRTATFSPSLDAWREGPDLPEARFGAVAVATEERLHLLGGEGDGRRRAAALAMDPTSLHWLEAPQPFAQGHLAAAAAEGVVYVLQAEGDEEFRLESCEVEDVFYVHEGWSGADVKTP